MTEVPAADRPELTVVAPTHNRVVRAVRLLEALARQEDVGRFEVVLVDDGSSDGTSEAAAAVADGLPYELVVITSPQAQGPAAARNLGWRAARSDRIAFVDDDCVPDPGWLAALAFGLDKADVVIGRTRPPEDQLGQIGTFSAYLDIGHNGSFSTCNIAYRLPVLEALDGFDQANFRYPNGEDTDLGLRAVKAGYEDLYAEEALMWHDVHPSDFRSYFARIVRRDGLISLVARHPEARQYLNCGRFLRSIEKAVLIFWGAATWVAVRPRSRLAWSAVAVALALYLWQFAKCYPDGSRSERIRVIPLAFAGDNWSLLVMIRGSLRWRTILL